MLLSVLLGLFLCSSSVLADYYKVAQNTSGEQTFVAIFEHDGDFEVGDGIFETADAAQESVEGALAEYKKPMTLGTKIGLGLFFGNAATVPATAYFLDPTGGWIVLGAQTGLAAVSFLIGKCCCGGDKIAKLLHL